MVKNAGGNKGKKVARKNTADKSNDYSQEVRRISDPSEMYAAVTKINNSRRCDVIAMDGITYQCTVRGKFLKNKRGGNNSLMPGVWIMIGFYDWEVRGDGNKTCDLLEIYTANEKDKLKQLEASKLKAIMHIGELAGSENEFTFSKFTEQTEEEQLSSSDEGEEEDNKELAVPKPEPIIPLSVLVTPKKKEPVQDQMDWLNINERDI